MYLDQNLLLMCCHLSLWGFGSSEFRSPPLKSSLSSRCKIIALGAGLRLGIMISVSHSCFFPTSASFLWGLETPRSNETVSHSLLVSSLNLGWRVSCLGLRISSCYYACEETLVAWFFSFWAPFICFPWWWWDWEHPYGRATQILSSNSAVCCCFLL